MLGQLIKLEFLSSASGAEMAVVERMKKIVPFVTCEFTFGQHVCELMFGINVSNPVATGFLFFTESVKEGTHQKSRKGATAVTCGIGPRPGHPARKAHSQKNSVTPKSDAAWAFAAVQVNIAAHLLRHAASTLAFNNSGAS